MNKKKILYGLGALGVAIAIMPLFAAFEAHVVNVTAKIENALGVSTEAIDFGTVFPQEHLDQPLAISLSQSFLDEDRVDDVDYFIRQKPKCGVTSTNGTVLIGPTATGHVGLGPDDTIQIDCGEPPRALVAGENWGVLPSLCPYISKEDDNTPDNDGTLASFHQPFTIVNHQVVWNDTPGRLVKSTGDTVDNWTIDLAVPCFGGFCAQDWESFVHGINPDADPALYTQPIANEHKVFGCDLWVEVGGVSEVEPVTAQCNDGIDNADTEDALVDAADPGCHSDGNAANSGSYVPTDNDERDSVGALQSAYVQPSGADCDVNVTDVGGDGEIQAGVNTATAGQTVCVGPGTYNENVSITTGITLAGDGATATSTINGNVTIQADNATLMGFDINGQVLVKQYSDTRVAYNKVTVATNVGAIEYGPASGGALTSSGQGIVEHNVVSSTLGRGISFDQNGVMDFMARYNDVNARKAILFGSQSGGSAFRNDLSSTPTTGADVEAYGNNVMVSYNNLTGRVLENEGTSDVMNAENNWWGQATGPAAGQTVGDVDSTPFEVTALPEN